MPVLFSIIGQRLGSLDLLLPVFMEVKHHRPETPIDLIFPERRPYDQMRRDAFISSETSRLARHITVLDREPTSGNGTRNHVESAIRLAPTILRMLLSPRFILLHCRTLRTVKMGCLFFINKMMRGKTFEHFQGLVLTLGRRPPFERSGRDEGDGFLGYGPHDRPYLEALGKSRVLEIGYPRLYSAWLQRLRDVSDAYVDRELERYHLPRGRPIVTLMLASTVPGVFLKEELEQWIRDAFSAVQAVLPEAVILLKPHPMQKMEHLEATVRKLEPQNAAITFLHPGVLAASSRVVVSHHSSTIIDAMALGVPTIQYQELTPHWLERHPEGSSFLALDPLWARNAAELEGCMRTAISGEYAVPDIRPALGHRQDLSALLGDQP